MKPDPGDIKPDPGDINLPPLTQDQIEYLERLMSAHEPYDPSVIIGREYEI